VTAETTDFTQFFGRENLGTSTAAQATQSNGVTVLLLSHA
jgi:hypothetical protein